ncbi:MAG TPA: serine/threonine-protein kinase [Gemmatimonadales bacterium]|nr:serine/threonine-protein kinase [Gemmatimonadales bacterium]
MTGPRPSTTLVCGGCGKPLVRGARFCLACGQPAPVDAALSAAISGEGSLTLSDPERQARLEAMLVEATMGEFEVLGELGRGGMATVYLAQDLALDRKVAIKVVAPSLLTGSGAVERFKREARTAAALSHPHIIPVHAVRETPDLIFFVMKFVEGRPLDDILRGEQALPLRMVQAILFEVGQALAYAHRRGVVHRDIKPANIMLDGEGFSVVTDFGIAKPMQADSMTATGSMIGTPYYMSPEQCGGKPVTGASDQYSLGVVAYQMITGRRPFAGETIMEILKGHFFETPAPILEVRPDCPPELAAVVDRMLSKEVGDRYASMDETLQAMACTPLASDDPVRTQMIELARSSEKLQAIGKLKVPLSPVPLARSRAAVSRSISNPPMPSPVADRAPAAPPPVRWPLILGAVVLLAVAGAGAVWWIPRRSAPTPSAADTTTAPVAPPTPTPTVVPPSRDSGATRVPPDSGKPAPSPPAAAEPVAPPPVVKPAPARPDPALVAAQQRREIQAYATRIERFLAADWANAIIEDVDPADVARFRMEIQPNGSVPVFPTALTEGRLTDLASDGLTLTIGALPELPSSWGSRPLTVELRYTTKTVTVIGPR